MSGVAAAAANMAKIAGGGGVEAGGAALRTAATVEKTAAAMPHAAVAGGLESGLNTPAATLKNLAEIKIDPKVLSGETGGKVGGLPLETKPFSVSDPELKTDGLVQPLTKEGQIPTAAAGGSGKEPGSLTATAVEPPHDGGGDSGKIDAINPARPELGEKGKDPAGAEFASLTQAQKERMGELGDKGNLTIAEREELGQLRKTAEVDPAKRYDEIGEKADRGEPLTDDDRKFAAEHEARQKESGTEEMQTPEQKQEQEVVKLEDAGVNALEVLANPDSTPEDVEKALADFREQYDKVNNFDADTKAKNQESMRKAVKEMLKPGQDGKESTQAQQLREKLQTLMQAEAQLMIYKQQLIQLREQYNKVRDQLRKADPWWGRATYEKDSKQRAEKYKLYSQLIGLQEAGKRIVNITHEVKATYVENVAALNRALRVNGAMGSIADFVVAKGYKVNAFAHREVDWLTANVRSL